MIRLRSTAIVLTVALFSHRASADPTPKELQTARDLFAAAQDLQGHNEWEKALEKLQQAVAIKETAGLRFYIAYSNEKLGRLATALAEYETAQRLADIQKKDDVQKMVREPIQRLRARVPQIGVASVAPNNAAVQIDGRAIVGPEFTSVDPGEHLISANADGYENYSHPVTLKESDHLRLDIALVHLKPVETPQVALVTHAEPPHANRTGAIITTAGTLLLAGVGVATLLAASNTASTASGPDGHACRVAGTCETDQSTVRVLDWTSLGCFIGATGLGVLSIVLWTKRPSFANTASVTITPHLGGAALGGAF